MSIDVCIGNYGYYNEGELRDARETSALIAEVNTIDREAPAR